MVCSTEGSKGTRIALAPYENTFIQGDGWVNGWMDEGEYIRYIITKPTIKQADKHTHYSNLKVISKEHHINLFIPKEVKSLIRTERYAHANFSGFIQEYKRKDGSYDWGVYPSPSIDVNLLIDIAVKEIRAMIKKSSNAYSIENLYTIHNEIKPMMVEIENRISMEGDYMLTHSYTYDEVMDELIRMNHLLDVWTERFKLICSNRSMRRQYKIPFNPFNNEQKVMI